MSPPIDIDGSEIQEATIDGQDVSEITIDGQQAAPLNVIPDSANLLSNWDYRAASSASTIPDLEGVADLEVISGDPTLEASGINGQQTGRYDASPDIHGSTSWLSLSQPFTVATIYQYVTLPSNTTEWNRFGGSNNRVTAFSGGSSFGIFAGNSSTGGTVDTNVHIEIDVYDGPNSLIEIDRSTVMSGTDIGSNGTDGVVEIGGDSTRSRGVDARVGQQLVWGVAQDNSIRDDIVDYINSEWGTSK